MPLQLCAARSAARFRLPLTHHSPPSHPLPPPCRYQAAIGYPDAAKECLLKRVRALGGAGWQASEEGFQTYAAASLALCRAYLQVGAGLAIFLLQAY